MIETRERDEAVSLAATIESTHEIRLDEGAAT